MRRLIAPLLASFPSLPLQAEGSHPTLIFPAPLAPDLQGLPRLEGTDPVARKINAVLAAQDARTLEARNDCLDDPNNSFAGGFDVTLHGPHFPSILSWTSPSCGMAPPWSDPSVLLFNLKTGAEIDPVALLPKALRPLSEEDDLAAADEESSGPRVNPLTDLYLSRLALDPRTHAAAFNDIDCTEVLTHNGHGFLIWPDAKAHALMLVPYGLPYIFTLCQNEVAVPVALLLRLQASPRLTAALARDE